MHMEILTLIVTLNFFKKINISDTELNSFVESLKIYHIRTMKINVQTVITTVALRDSSLKKSITFISYRMGMKKCFQT